MDHASTPSPTTPATHANTFAARGLRPVLYALHISFALAPLLFLLILYAISFYILQSTGRWPHYSIPRERWICDFVNWTTWWCLGSWVGFPALSIVLRRTYAQRWLIALIAIFLLGWVLIFPVMMLGGLAWFFD